MIAAALLLAGQSAAAPPPATPTTSPTPPTIAENGVFAPPLGQPMRYRVTTRRLTRDGTMASYTLVYALQCERVGRGIQLVATLRGIESDARPDLAKAVSGLVQPLVGEAITYLVAADGSRIDPVDPEALWERVTARIQAMAAAAERPEAQQVARLLAALPPAEREKLATADVRALVAPANADIPAFPAVGVTVRQDGALRIVARTEKSALATKAGPPQPLDIDRSWAIDAATGLLVGERRQSWIAAPDGGGRKLVEEQIRALDIVP